MNDKELIEKMKSDFKVRSLEDVAEKLGYKRTTASTWRSRGLPDIVKLKYSQKIKSNGIILNDNTGETVKLDYYPNISASAGYGYINGDQNKRTIELNRSFLSILGINHYTKLDVIHVYGDSMEPLIKNGEMIIVERDTPAHNNDIVIANINGEVYVKRFQKDPFGKWVKLTSSNEFYSDIELKEDELNYLEIVGVVKAKIRPM